MDANVRGVIECLHPPGKTVARCSLILLANTRFVLHDSVQAERLIFFSPRQVRRAFCALCCIACLTFAPRAAANFSDQCVPSVQDSAKQSSEQGPPQRIPRQQSQTTAALDGLVRDASSAAAPLPVAASIVTLRTTHSHQPSTPTTSPQTASRLFPL